MEDLYYFTKADVGLDDIKKIAERTGYESREYIRANDQWLNIYYDEKHFWQWSKLYEENGDFEGFETPQQNVLTQFQPTSSFLIEYHVDSKLNLVPFLKFILAYYDGWIGCNDGDFLKIYTEKNIENLEYHF